MSWKLFTRCGDRLGHRVQCLVLGGWDVLEQAEVAVVPGEAFGTPGYLRLSYAVSDEYAQERASRIQQVLADARE